jgi:MFS family permease
MNTRDEAGSVLIEDGANLLASRYRRVFIATMFCVCFFNFADRAVFAVLAQTIKQELGLTDLQLGILQGFSFAILYAGLGLPIGRLAERASRVRIVAAATLFWSVATALCGLAGSFFQMMLARIGVGVGEAGFMPPTSSLVADHFPRERRASTMSLIMLGTPAGLLFGSLIGGAVAGAIGWRVAFLALGIPGAVVGLLVFWILREPSRGLVDGASPTPRAPPDFRAYLREMRRKPALLLVTLGGGLAGFGMTSISQFLAVFLARAHHMAVREAAAFYGTISAISLMLGLLIGSFGTDWLAKRDGRWPAWGAALGLCVAPFVYWVALTSQSKVTASVLLTLAGSIMLLFYGPTTGMIQNMLEPRMRATGAAVFGILYTLIGAGFGPTFVGWMSDRMAERAFSGGGFLLHCPAGGSMARMPGAIGEACRHASMEGVRNALMIAVCVLFVAGCFYWFAARTLRAHQYDPSAARPQE